MPQLGLQCCQNRISNPIIFNIPPCNIDGERYLKAMARRVIDIIVTHEKGDVDIFDDGKNPIPTRFGVGYPAW